MNRILAALCFALLACLAVPASAQTSSNAYAICSNQTYALCASASSFVYQDLAYAKCVIKHGNSISAPPLTYDANGQQRNVCDVNAEGETQGFMMSTFSLPDEVRKGGNKAVYTCPGGSTGDYAQCDGGTCFKSTTGQYFPGIGQIGAGEIVCSCPITQPTASKAPFGFQFIGPYPCQKRAFSVCQKETRNGSIIPVGSPPGAGRILTEALYGQQYPINECLEK